MQIILWKLWKLVNTGFYWQVSRCNCLVKARDMNLTLQPILQTDISPALPSSIKDILFIYLCICIISLFFCLNTSIGTDSVLKGK